MEGLFDFFDGVELSVPTWDDFWERGSSGWSFLPPFSHSQPLSLRLFGVNCRGRRGEWGFFYPLVWARTTGASFSVLLLTTGERGIMVCGRASSGPSSPGKLRRGDQSHHSASRRVSFPILLREACALPPPTSWERK